MHHHHHIGGRLHLFYQFKTAAIVLLIAGISIPQAFSQRPVSSVRAALGLEPEESKKERIVLSTGASLVIALPGEASRVALSDEKIASVRVLSKTELLLTGNHFGQTTMHAWLEDGTRLLYPVNIGRDLSLLGNVLQRIDPSIKVTESPASDLVMLEGNVATSALSEEARRRAEQFLAQSGGGAKGPAVVNLINSETPATPDMRLQQALQTIDPRITVRRIQVGLEGNPEVDSYILEGRVRNLIMLQRALEIADRQLGGTGGQVTAPQHSSFTPGRGNLSLGGGGSGGGSGSASAGGVSTSTSSGGGGGNGSGGGGSGGAGGRAPSDLATFVSRGLVLTTKGGRVVSFLEVDQLGQILVSIRALEINRNLARQKGINFSVTGEQFAIGNYTGPFPVGAAPAPTGAGSRLIGSAAAALGGGAAANLVGAYVGDSVSVLSAIDFIENRGIGRTVANPNVLTLTGEQSSIQIGGQVPIPTTTVSTSSTTQGFFFQNYGIQLDIRPTIDDKGVITLEAVPSITSPDVGVAVEGVPGFKVQQVSTTARVLDGQSLILGGLIHYEEDSRERKVPVLGDIPVVKNAFRWNKKERLERELLFVITPKVRPSEVEGVKEHFQLPGLDSRQQIPIKEQAKPIELGPEGIPLNWLNIGDDGLAHYAGGKNAIAGSSEPNPTPPILPTADLPREEKEAEPQSEVKESASENAPKRKSQRTRLTFADIFGTKSKSDSLSEPEDENSSSEEAEKPGAAMRATVIQTDAEPKAEAKKLDTSSDKDKKADDLRKKARARRIHKY